MFNKEMISDDSNFKFLKEKLADGFLIPNDGKSKVIFGYNGIGKTSIFRFIKSQDDSSKYMYVDYIDERDEIIKKKKKLIIGPNINKINSLKDQIAECKSKMGINDVIKNKFGIGSKPKARNFGEKMERAYSDEFDGFVLAKEELKRLEDLTSNIPKSFFVSNINLLNSVLKIDEEIKNYKNSAIFKALTILDEIVESNDDSCPVCETKVENIKKIIEEKINKLYEIKSEIIEKLKSYNIPISNASEIIENSIEVTKILNTQEKLTDWIICDGSIERYDKLLEDKKELDDYMIELETLENEKNRFYERIKENGDRLKQHIKRYYNVSERKIVFSDEEKTVHITLPREVKTYSTGELNFLLFLIRIYEFLGSDRQTLILDDPVSSLDIINHYKIVFEIVKAATSDKTLIILTHSIELVNSINSQMQGAFDFYYIDEIEGKLVIQKIETESNFDNIVSLGRLREHDEKRIIEALIKKESSSYNDNIHKLFHYDGDYTYEDLELSNIDFIEMIDNFAPVIDTDFLKNTYNKIIHIVALRVWVEKKLRDLIHDESLIESYDNADKLYKKINVIFPRNADPLIDSPQKLNREILLSKKVMLNQGIHYQSQIMPFAYAMNISLDDLNREIAEIKSLFY